MRHGLDEYAHLHSPVHDWEPRCKLIALMALIFAFTFVQHPYLLLPMLGVTAVLYGVSKLPLSFLRSRLHYPGYFLLGVTVLLPFVSGQTIWVQLGGVSVYREGLLAAIAIAARFISIVMVGLVLFGSSPIVTTIKAMRSLGLPKTLADMTLLFYRYLYEIGGDLIRMQTAMRLRGFRMRRPSRRNLKVLAALAGSLLIRSYEQSERVYGAMRLRGYGSEIKASRTDWQVRPRDAIAMAIVLLVAVVFVGAEIALRGMEIQARSQL